MNKYIAGFKNGKIEIEADSLYGAKLKAIDHFKPSKKDSGLLWVALADVTHSTASL